MEWTSDFSTTKSGLKICCLSSPPASLFPPPPPQLCTALATRHSTPASHTAASTNPTTIRCCGRSVRPYGQLHTVVWLPPALGAQLVAFDVEDHGARLVSPNSGLLHSPACTRHTQDTEPNGAQPGRRETRAFARQLNRQAHID
eukprot:2189881-Prymnesium_polylepis.2